MIEILRYIDPSGTDVFGEWLSAIKDKRTRAKILSRTDRVALGNFGDSKALAGGVRELRIDWGPGYRVYFGRVGQAVVVLLCGGDKRSQTADIRRAVAFWKNFQQRMGDS